MTASDETRKPEPNGADPLQAALTSLRRILAEERSHLEDGRIDRLDRFAREKQQILSGLERLKPDAGEEMASASNSSEIREIAALLEENRKLLAVRISAIGELTATISNAIRDAESDGTYEANGYNF